MMQYLMDLIRYHLASCAGAGADFINPVPRPLIPQALSQDRDPPLFDTPDLVSFRDDDDCADLRWERVTPPDSETPCFLLTEYGEGGQHTQHIFSEAVYHLADPFPSMRVKADALKAYRSLGEDQQQIVLRFLTEEGCTRSLFHCICYLATYACTGARLDEIGLRRAVAAFNSNFAGELNCSEVDVRELSVLLGVGQLAKHLEIDPNCRREGRTPWRTLLCVYAVIHGCSVWSSGNRTAADALLRSGLADSKHMTPSLNRVCDGNTGDQLARELLQLHEAGESRDTAARLLFSLLQQHRHLRRTTVRKITDALFREGVSVEQEMGMDILMNGPNGDIFERYVTHSFFTGATAGDDSFAFASAAIKTHALRRNYQDVLQGAIAQIRRESHPALVMQGLAILTMYCRSRVSLLSTMRLGIELRREKLLHMKLICWLMDPSSPFYKLACDTVEGLYLMYGFDTRKLCREDIIRAACCAWQQNLHPAHGRKILSLLPMGTRLSNVPDRKKLSRSAFGMYRYHLADGYYPGVVRDFRLCANMGCWKDAELRSHYRQLAILLGREKNRVTAEDQCCMQLLRHEMHRLMDKDNTFRETPGAALNEMLCGMGSKETERLNALAEEPDTICILTTAAQALQVLEYVRREYQNDPACTGDSAALLRRCRIETKDIGSSVIADWFEMLCCFGFTEEALEFYKAHAGILNRPWCYMNGLLIDNDWTGLQTYGKFLETESRLSKAMGMAMFLNHRNLVRAFLDAVPHLQAEPLVKLLLEEDDEDNELETCPSLRDQTRSFWLDHLMGLPTPEKIMGFWNLHYDDRGLTRLVLKNCPTYHNLILRLGYSNDEEAALAAVTARGSSLMFVSGWLKRNDAVCTAALQNDCSVLHLVQAPMKKNRPLIRSLLLDSALPLHRSPDWLRDDREYVLKRVRRRGRELAYASDRLRQDPEVVQAAAQPDREEPSEPDTGWLYEDL